MYLWAYLVPKMQKKLATRDKKIEDLIVKAKLLDDYAEQLLWDYKEKKRAQKETHHEKMLSIQQFIAQSKLDIERDFKVKLSEAVQSLEMRLQQEHQLILKSFPDELSVVLAQFGSDYGLTEEETKLILLKQLKQDVKEVLE